MPEYTTFVAKRTGNLTSPIMDQFPRIDGNPFGLPYVVNYYGIGEGGEFGVHPSNPYIQIVKSWSKWGSIGDRVILVNLSIDASSSVKADAATLKKAVVNSIKALRSDKYAFTAATWVRVTTYNSKGVKVIIDWAPLESIEVDNISDIETAGSTPLSCANMLALNSVRNIAAAIKEHTDLKVIVCDLNAGDGMEYTGDAIQPFEAEDVAEYAGLREFVDAEGNQPLIHAQHRSSLYVGPANGIVACEDYANRSGASFHYLPKMDAKSLETWFVERVHTASALGEEPDDDETDGVIDFAAEVKDDDTDGVFADDGED